MTAPLTSGGWEQADGSEGVEPPVSDTQETTAAREQAQDAETGARRAADDARRAADDAGQRAGDAQEWSGNAARQAEDAGQSAQDAAERAGSAEQAAASAEDAVRAAKQSDSLLLDPEARRVAAQVTPEQPFGVPGSSTGERSDFRRGFSVAMGLLLAVVVGASLYTIRHELVLLLMAAFVAIGLDPAVRFLVRRGMSRTVAVAVIITILALLVSAFLAAVVPPIANEASSLARNAPQYARDLQDQHNAVGRLNARYNVTERLQQSIASGLSANTAGGILSAGGAVLSAVFELLIFAVLVIYLLADLPRITQVAYRLVPLRQRPRFGLLADEVVRRVGGYVFGTVATAVVAVITSYVLLLALHVPYALVLSVLTGVLDLVPLVGASIAGVVVALVALAAVSPTAALITVVFHIVYRIFEDYYLRPRVLHHTVSVSPLVTVIAVVVGGGLLGVVGALVAVPAAAAVQLVLTEVVFPRRDEAS